MMAMTAKTPVRLLLLTWSLSIPFSAFSFTTPEIGGLTHRQWSLATTTTTKKTMKHPQRFPRLFGTSENGVTNGSTNNGAATAASTDTAAAASQKDNLEAFEQDVATVLQKSEQTEPKNFPLAGKL